MCYGKVSSLLHWWHTPSYCKMTRTSLKTRVNWCATYISSPWFSVRFVSFYSSLVCVTSGTDCWPFRSTSGHPGFQWGSCHFTVAWCVSLEEQTADLSVAHQFTLVSRKRRNRQTMIYKTLQWKLKIKQHEPHWKPGWTDVLRKGQQSAPLVTHTKLL
jgi:hypothetical protein